jgi:hypothetical protein
VRLPSKERGAPVQGVCCCYKEVRYCYNYLCGPCARAPSLVIVAMNKPAITPRHRTGRGLYPTRGFRATNIVYAIILILAAAAVVTVAFLVVTALTS